MKKKSRPKSTPKAKPERKPKGGGKPKGPPKAKGKRASAAASKPKAPPPHKDPTVEGKPGDPDKMYGGFVLQLFDHDWRADAPAVYGGELRKVIFDKPIKTPAAAGTGGAAGSSNVQDQDTRMVAKLRRHLWTLGFWVFPRINKDGVIEPEASDTFDWRVEWAVREFQVAASMPNVAVQDIKKKPTEKEIQMPGKYLSTLSAKKNDKVFDEHPSGAVTTNTAEAIKYWLDKNYRCPLVIQAIERGQVLEPAAKGKKPKKKKARIVRTENLWRHDEVPHKGPRMFAWDFSGYYDCPRGMPITDVPVGKYVPWKSFGGPRGDNAWDGARLKPESWHGNKWGEMSEPERSTWRAIMAVAAQECSGGLDVINSWDNCLGSAGHFHWTMPKLSMPKHPEKTPPTVSGGEFCGLVSYLEYKYSDAFKKCFEKFGVWGPYWHDSQAGGDREKVSAGATYSGYIYTKDHHNKFVRQPTGQDKAAFEQTNWLRSWQWVYRLQLAARTCDEYRQATWDIAFQRLKNIVAMTCVDAWLPAKAKTAGGPKLTIGDVITSERGAAVLLRLHVRWSGALSAASKGKGGKAKPILHDAIQHVLGDKTLKDGDGKPLDWEKPPREWKTPHEVALVDALVHFTGVHGGPAQVASVSNARFWPFRVDKGKIVMRKIKIEKPADTKAKNGEDAQEKLVPVLVKADTGWVPDPVDPFLYGPDESGNSFKPYK